MIRIVFPALLIAFFVHQPFAARFDTLRVMSKSMNKAVPNIVILPAGYSEKGKPLPVLYLLHGATMSYTEWPTFMPGLKDEADRYGFIAVCADGGVTSWYFDSPVDPAMKYETYVSKELMAAVDGNYNTVKNRTGRAIMGLSMGGHGAFYLSFRHPDVYGAAGSISGGVDFRPFPNNWGLIQRLGTYAEHPENWEKNTVTNLLHLLNGKSLRLIFDCGTEDFFYTVNKMLHQKMVERKIPHDYTERPGKHDWDCFRNAARYQLMFMNDFFKSAK